LTIKFSQDKKSAAYLNCQRSMYLFSPQKLWGHLL